MKNLIKVLCIVMIVYSSILLSYEAFILLSVSFRAPAQFLFPFISHVAMLVLGIMGLKLGGKVGKQKMLAKISGVQTVLCIAAIVVSNALTTIDIFEWLSIIISILLLVYYTKEALNYHFKYER